MCDVPSVAIFCSEPIECFPRTASSFFIIIIVITISTYLKIVRPWCVPGNNLSLPTKSDIYLDFIHLHVKVAGSIPDGLNGFFHWHNPSGRTMALGLTQPLTEMSTRNTSWGVKGGRCVGLTTLPPSCADCPEIWEPQTSGTLRVCLGLQWDCFTFLSLILKFWQWADFHETLYERYTTRGLHFLNSLITKWWTRERH